MRRGNGEGETRGRGETAFFSPSPFLRFSPSQHGFSLIELVITVSVLAILTLGVVPLVQVSVKRQKEQQLRETLREMREAIDQFHREALAGAQYHVNQGTTGTTGTTSGIDPNSGLPAGTGRGPGTGTGTGTGVNPLADSRVRVMITDQTIFTADNPDRYPPDLETLVKGVSVLPITLPVQLQGGQGITGAGILERTENSNIPKTKIYLRQIPTDPITGQREWDFRSCYDSKDATSWGGENVFDVHSKSKGKALDGSNYSDW